MKLILPLTLAIVPGLVIKAGNQDFIFPQINIDELVRIKPEEVETRINMVNGSPVLRLRDMLLPLINLKDVLALDELKSAKGKNDDQNINIFKDVTEPVRVLVTKSGQFHLGIIVDSLENIEEIVVKPLPRYLKKFKSYSGASIMGNGEVALIIDVAGLVEKANLHFFDESDENAEKTKEEAQVNGELQRLLLFDNDTDERFAIPLELITRIEQVEANSIERVKDGQYLQYQGKKIKLIFLEDHLPVNRPKRNLEDKVGIIIPKNVKKPMGIVIKNVIGTVNTSVDLDTETIIAPGLFGSTVLEGKITLLPDMFTLFEIAAPEYFASKSLKKDKKKILLVEDTPFFRMVESDYLKSVGYEVVTAENGKQAMSTLNEQDFDGVVLDIVMPEMDGWATIKAIRKEDRWKDLPVIAVTTLGDEETIKEGLESGFTAWESKLNKTTLLEKLNSLVG